MPFHSEVGWSLRTKDPEEAKLRHAEAARQQALRWAALRSRPGPVPHRQLVALAGVYYRELDALIQDEPGEESLWMTMLAKFDVKDPGPDMVTNWFGEEADRLLTDAGISADVFSRARLCGELHRVSNSPALRQTGLLADRMPVGQRHGHRGRIPATGR